MSGEKKSILVIDDEPDVRTYLSTLLEDNGYQVSVAEDGEKGWAAIQAQRPDLVTLDVTMPEKSGVRCYRDIKENEEFKDIPVIMITGVSTDFEKFISTRRNIPAPEGYIHKPVDQNELLEKVAALLA